ncbi:hypothetical protein F5Y15DRAFT_246497 [Xylariaceae sp. FL0016]|nr:hypothetical protein F5Y15DRAFT_246497 [Xylariaceae sp. FL0016]
MLRSTAALPGPTPRGSTAEIETTRPHTRNRETARSDKRRGSTSSYHSNDAVSRLTPIANDGAVFSPNLLHQRQQSAPTFPPLNTNSRSHSPVRVHNRHQSYGMPFTGDTRGGRRQDRSPGRFAGWISGNSTPPAEEAPSPDTTPKSKREGTPIDSTPKSATQSRFGFLASSMSAFTTRLSNQPQARQPIDDELCDLHIETALFGSSSPSEQDTFSPAAYKNLQTNAVGLLHRMQDAYRERTLVLKEIQGEREAQREEIEETELRIRNCKNQLEKMAAKAAEQEQAMQQLVAELHAEKRARHEERVSREKILAEGSMVNEDLGVDEDERKRWRTSDGTVRSELSVDTDGDRSESESIFSRSRSPTALTIATEIESVDIPSHPKIPTLNLPRSKPPQQQLTTFQKLVKGISGDTARDENESPAGCRNCKGQDSSVAWDTVSLLRDENKGLKHRVAELEVVVEGALDVVNGVGL